MKVQWYPGHMAKAKRAMQEALGLIDLVVELTDARCPDAGRNPDIDRLAAGKARMILLNKADLADEQKNKVWQSYFRDQGMTAVCIDARKGNFRKSFLEAAQAACREKIERDRRRGILNRPIRAMIAGVPNVGKSTFINSIAGKGSAKTGDKPGVTRGNQWIHVSKQMDLLDTPGILWPKFEDPEAGTLLALIGTINDEIFSREEAAAELLGFLKKEYPELTAKAFGEILDKDKAFWLDDIACARGCLKKGGVPDGEKAAALVLDDFRGGKLGRITLQMPGVRSFAAESL